jgi:hypothetical protein
MENLEKYTTELKHSLARDSSSSMNPQERDFIASVQCTLNHCSLRPLKAEFDSRWWTQTQLKFHLLGYHGMRAKQVPETTKSIFAEARRAKVARIERKKLEQPTAFLTPVDPTHLTFLKTRKRGVHPKFLASIVQRIERARQRRKMRECE